MLYRLDERFAGLRPDALATSAIVGAFALAALVTGLVIATGQPIPIILTVGMIAGVVLLGALPLVIWIILVGVLLVSGPVTMFVPALEKAGWLFSLLGFYLAGAALLYAAIGRQRFARRAPAFVHIAVFFFIFGLVSLLYSGGPFGEGLRATKRYFQFFGLMFVLAAVPFEPQLVRRWWGFLIALACIQLPFALFQRVVLVPAREGMPNLDAIDIVVGSMEGLLTGGGSNGVMALFLITMLAYLLAAHRDGVLPLRRILPLSALFTIPLVLGEVKLIVVILPIAMIAVYLDLVRVNFLRFFLAALFAVVLLAALGWGYLAINAHPGESVDRIIESTIAYNFGDTGYFGTGLNRTSVYPYWFAHQRLSDPVAFVFGNGLGSSFGGIDASDPGHMDRLHAWMHIGLTAASSVLWDLGILGLGLLVALHVSAIRYAGRLVAMSAPGFDRAFCRTLRALALMLPVMLLYSEAPISVPSQEVLAALCFGLIAWRWRIHGHPIGLDRGAR